MRDRRYCCVKCSDENRIKNKVHDIDKVLIQIQTIHPQLIFNIDENYINKRSWIGVECKKHGIFKKKVQKLISGQGCLKCTIDNLIDEGRLLGGYSEKIFRDNPDLKNIDGYIYLLKIDDLFKIGITRTSVNDRIKALKSKSKCKIIKEIKSIELNFYKAFQLEQKILEKYKSQRIYTKWSTELVSIDISNDELLNKNQI